MTNSTTTGPEESPNKFDEWKESRKISGAGTYPNYYSHVTHSGHKIVIDDSEGAEHITIEHRGGHRIQFKPKGEIVVRAHNGMQSIVFGNNQVHVSGSQDVHVRGGGSLFIEGDYNHTISGDVNFTVGKNVNWVVMKAFNMHAGDEGVQMTTSGNMAIKSNKNIEMTADGTAKLGATGGLVLAAKGGDLSLLTDGKFTLGGHGDAEVQSSGTLYLTGKTAVRINES
jgi:uncharacterized protein (DUF2345 family)